MRIVGTPTILAVLLIAAPAQAHDFYNDWKMPSGASCCNDKDCRPTRAYVDDDGWWRAEIAGRWISVPPSAVLNRVAPDGGSHICVTPGGIILCFVGGTPKS